MSGRPAPWRRSGDFLETRIDRGTRLFHRPDRRFKTVLVRLLLWRPLDGLATETALLPYVLRRGSVRFPTEGDLRRHLESAYGTVLEVDVQRFGHLHAMVLHAEFLAGRFVPGGGGEDLLEESFGLLGEILFRPRLVRGGFDADVLDQEKRALRNALHELADNKDRYAFERCRQELHKGHPFAAGRFGKESDLRRITPRGLAGFHREILDSAPIDIYVVGDAPRGTLRRAVAGLVRGLRRTPSLPRRPVRTIPFRGERRLTERQEVSQSKLCLAFHASPTGGSRLDRALPIYNGILGEFPHSKLFEEVREKASLAYAIHSTTDRLLGTLYVFAGIHPGREREATSIITREMRKIREGAFGDHEWESTLAALRNRLRQVREERGGLIARHIAGRLRGRLETIREARAALHRVTRGDVVGLARAIRPALTFLLRGTERG